jgi:hypothetical protein
METSTLVPLPPFLAPHALTCSPLLCRAGNILVTHDPKKGYSLIFLDCGIVTKVRVLPSCLSLTSLPPPPVASDQVKKNQFRSLLDICLALLHYDGRKAADLLADHSVQVSPYDSLPSLPPSLTDPPPSTLREQYERYCSGIEGIVSRASQLNYFENLGDYVTEVSPSLHISVSPTRTPSASCRSVV